MKSESLHDGMFCAKVQLLAGTKIVPDKTSLIYQLKNIDSFDRPKHANFMLHQAADEISRLRAVIRINMLRLMPKITHKEIDKILNDNIFERDK